MDNKFQFLSVTEAARELDLTGGRIRQLLLAGELTGHKLGGMWAVPACEIERFKAAREKNGETQQPLLSRVMPNLGLAPMPEYRKTG